MTVETKTNLTLPPGQTKATIIPQNTTAFTVNVCFDYEGENIPSDVGKRNNVAYVVLCMESSLFMEDQFEDFFSHSLPMNLSPHILVMKIY